MPPKSRNYPNTQRRSHQPTTSSNYRWNQQGPPIGNDDDNSGGCRVPGCTLNCGRNMAVPQPSQQLHFRVNNSNANIAQPQENYGNNAGNMYVQQMPIEPHQPQPYQIPMIEQHPVPQEAQMMHSPFYQAPMMVQQITPAMPHQMQPFQAPTMEQGPSNGHHYNQHQQNGPPFFPNNGHQSNFNQNAAYQAYPPPPTPYNGPISNQSQGVGYQQCQPPPVQHNGMYVDHGQAPLNNGPQFYQQQFAVAPPVPMQNNPQQMNGYQYAQSVPPFQQKATSFPNDGMYVDNGQTGFINGNGNYQNQPVVAPFAPMQYSGPTNCQNPPQEMMAHPPALYNGPFVEPNFMQPMQNNNGYAPPNKTIGGTVFYAPFVPMQNGNNCPPPHSAVDNSRGQGPSQTPNDRVSYPSRYVAPSEPSSAPVLKNVPPKKKIQQVGDPDETPSVMKTAPQKPSSKQTDDSKKSPKVLKTAPTKPQKIGDLAETPKTTLHEKWTQTERTKTKEMGTDSCDIADTKTCEKCSMSTVLSKIPESFKNNVENDENLACALEEIDVEDPTQSPFEQLGIESIFQKVETPADNEEEVMRTVENSSTKKEDFFLEIKKADTDDENVNVKNNSVKLQNGEEDKNEKCLEEIVDEMNDSSVEIFPQTINATSAPSVEEILDEDTPSSSTSVIDDAEIHVGHYSTSPTVDLIKSDELSCNEEVPKPEVDPRSKGKTSPKSKAQSKAQKKKDKKKKSQENKSKALEVCEDEFTYEMTECERFFDEGTKELTKCQDIPLAISMLKRGAKIAKEDRRKLVIRDRLMFCFLFNYNQEELMIPLRNRRFYEEEYAKNRVELESKLDRDALKFEVGTISKYSGKNKCQSHALPIQFSVTLNMKSKKKQKVFFCAMCVFMKRNSPGLQNWPVNIIEMLGKIHDYLLENKTDKVDMTWFSAELDKLNVTNPTGATPSIRTLAEHNARHRYILYFRLKSKDKCELHNGMNVGFVRIGSYDQKYTEHILCPTCFTDAVSGRRRGIPSNIWFTLCVLVFSQVESVDRANVEEKFAFGLPEPGNFVNHTYGIIRRAFGFDVVVPG